MQVALGVKVWYQKNNFQKFTKAGLLEFEMFYLSRIYRMAPFLSLLQKSFI